MLLHERLKGKRIILASKSPRRRQLIGDAGIAFDVAEDFDIAEIYPDDLNENEVAQYLAKLKSDGYPHLLLPHEILITADTVVIHDGRILGKPADRASAIEMLKRLSGSRHRVVTGVVLRSAVDCVEFSAATDVWFRELRNEEIEYYVDTYAPFDKAGSYGIQEWIGYTAIERIEGSFYNVMGLPIQMLYRNLEKLL